MAAPVTIDSREYAALLADARAARTDDLTGLLGRRGLRHAYASIATPPGVVALLDLDGFKQVNDSLGHEAGDAVLCVVASRLIQHADVAARLGGDEFVVLAPSVGVVERIADLIAEPIYLGGGTTVTVTASVGVVTHPTGRLSEDLSHADRAMYRAKRNGGGIRLWSTADVATRTAWERGERRESPVDLVKRGAAA